MSEKPPTGRDAGEEEDDGPSDEAILSDQSVTTVCGAEIARVALKALGEGLETGTFDLSRRDLTDESLMKTVKAVGIIAKLKNLMPRRTSILPITEVDVSNVDIVVPTPHPITGTPKLGERSLQPLQLLVQFCRVMTDVKVVRLENCNLQGTTHDKDDKVEQEIIRLVKKFGTSKDARYAREVSLAGNKLESEFAKKIIEAAYWERARAGEKGSPPRLYINLSRNNIKSPMQLLEELREGRNAGGSIHVAASTDPRDIRDKAIIVVQID
eukprot:CAMPEP_0179226636 /NCGR_PEP_ID=MMETSP0797-20121207/8913_1 /TAXON_ID=47934 /ORGANISM="Dinophysis acuminata, Strain DAEP01" /LENGTH=268 /DNA_ID=CAMNT_0020933665 /DNA_START=69 /DNA_END=872 /DNA_ORIENTATION=+